MTHSTKTLITLLVLTWPVVLVGMVSRLSKLGYAMGIGIVMELLKD